MSFVEPGTSPVMAAGPIAFGTEPTDLGEWLRGSRETRRVASCQNPNAPKRLSPILRRCQRCDIAVVQFRPIGRHVGELELGNGRAIHTPNQTSPEEESNGLHSSFAKFGQGKSAPRVFVLSKTFARWFSSRAFFGREAAIRILVVRGPLAPRAHRASL